MKYGSFIWVLFMVIGIIKNEKYKGDIFLGKIFIVDLIFKCCFENMGEEDKFYMKDYYELIISEEVFEKV